MPDNPDEPEEQVSVDQLTPEEASRIIHSHRKVRYGKTPSPQASYWQYHRERFTPNESMASRGLVGLIINNRNRVLAMPPAKGEVRQQAAV